MKLYQIKLQEANDGTMGSGFSSKDDPYFGVGHSNYSYYGKKR